MGRQTIEKVKWTCDHCGSARETAPGDISTPLGFIEIKGIFYSTEAQATPFEGLYCSFMCASEAVKAQGQGMGGRKLEANPAAVVKPAAVEVKPAVMEAKPAVAGGAEAKLAEERKEAESPISRVRFRRR